MLYTNSVMCNILDSFLYELDKCKFINIDTEQMKLVGIGFGGNIAACFLSQMDGADNFFIKSALLINSFSYVDQLIKEQLL